MLSLRTRIFIIISLAVLAILGISLLLIISGNKNKTANQTLTPQTVSEQNGSSDIGPSAGAQAPTGLPIKPQTSDEAEQNLAKQLAKIFVERYGSYSTDNNFQNLKEVESLVTDSFWSNISSKITNPTKQEFTGVTTKVVAMKIPQSGKTEAVVELQTKRTEEKNGNISNSYQIVTVDMVKSGDSWLVSDAVWK